jgi:hypothetical protein
VSEGFLSALQVWAHSCSGQMAGMISWIPAQDDPTWQKLPLVVSELCGSALPMLGREFQKNKSSKPVSSWPAGHWFVVGLVGCLLVAAPCLVAVCYHVWLL